jgi:hypothetical protein
MHEDFLIKRKFGCRLDMTFAVGHLLKISIHVPLILLKTTGTLEGIGSLATYVSFLVRSEITFLIRVT